MTRLHCNTCGTTIDGEFSVGRFARLGRDQMLLLEAFLRSRGNLRELERELGVSYPTVRGRVEALIRAIGLSDGTPLPQGPEPKADEPHVDPETRRAVLERLSRREITAEQAAAALRGETPLMDAAPASDAGAAPGATAAATNQPSEDDNDTEEE